MFKDMSKSMYCLGVMCDISSVKVLNHQMVSNWGCSLAHWGVKWENKPSPTKECGNYFDLNSSKSCMCYSFILKHLSYFIDVHLKKKLSNSSYASLIVLLIIFDSRHIDSLGLGLEMIIKENLQSACSWKILNDNIVFTSSMKFTVCWIRFTKG